MKFEKDEFYLIRWHDAAEQDGPDVAEFGAVMETLGWIVKSNRHGVRLANERYVPPGTGTLEYRGITDIPRKIILNATHFSLEGEPNG